MKAISLTPDWAMLVSGGSKTVECRSWRTDYRGDLLICSSSRRISGTIPGHALCVCTLHDIVPFTKDHLEQACMSALPEKPSFAWLLSDVRDIKPFPVKGRLHLFDVDDSAIEFLNPESEDEADRLFEQFYEPLFI